MYVPKWLHVSGYISYEDMTENYMPAAPGETEDLKGYSKYNEAIRYYQDLYNTAKEKQDYVGMNRAHRGAEKIRNLVLGEYHTDTYDYTYGGGLHEYSIGAYTGTQHDGGDGFVENIGTLYILNLDGTTEEQAIIADNQSIGTYDFVAIDYRDSSDPNIQIRNSYKAGSDQVISSVIDALLEYEKDYNSDWDRTKKSMKAEWKFHNIAASIGYEINRSKHVDLNNRDENTNWIKRAADELMDKIANKAD